MLANEQVDLRDGGVRMDYLGFYRPFTPQLPLTGPCPLSLSTSGLFLEYTSYATFQDYSDRRTGHILPLRERMKKQSLGGIHRTS